MKACAAHQGAPGGTRSVLASFNGLVGRVSQAAQADPYVLNNLSRTKRETPAIANQPIPTASFSGNEKNSFFYNLGDGRFEEIGSVTGLSRPEDGRGFVLADLDRNGSLDVVIHNFYLNPLVVLRNDVHEKPASITIKLRGTKSNRFGIGARVTVESPELPSQTQELACGTGYLSGNPPEMIFAVPTRARLKVRWPNGLKQEFAEIPSRRTVTLTEGEAAPKLEEYRPVALGKAPPIPAPPLREGDLWPKEVELSAAPGPRVVVLFSVDCNVCRRELLDWKSARDEAARIRDGALVWVNVGGGDSRIASDLAALHAEVSPVLPGPAGVRALFPEGKPTYPLAFVLDSTGRVRAKFVGAGCVSSAIRFASK